MSESVWQKLGDRLDAGRARPTALRGIQAFPMRSRSGEQYIVVRNPVGTAFLRLAPWQYDILTAMDGTRTL
jgi:hypothetical protein